MSDLIKHRSKYHEVVHEFSGKEHFYTVNSSSNTIYHVAFKVCCTCRYQSVQGTPNSKICSHILSVINKISDTGDVSWSKEGEM